jgi:hypothetical protein
MEAKDRSGIWQPVEERYMYACGNGINTVILPPSEIVLTSAVIYDGNFETDLRLNFMGAYSNMFRGKINLAQFVDRDRF